MSSLEIIINISKRVLLDTHTHNLYYTSKYKNDDNHYAQIDYSVHTNHLRECGLGKIESRFNGKLSPVHDIERGKLSPGRKPYSFHYFFFECTYFIGFV